MVVRDGDWRLYDHDFQSGRTVWVMQDGNRTVFRTDYPVEATIAANEATRYAAGKAWKGDYHLIASVPLNLLHDQNIGLLKAHSEGDDKYLSRWLNDADNRAWRAKEGRV